MSPTSYQTALPRDTDTIIAKFSDLSKITKKTPPKEKIVSKILLFLSEIQE